MDKRQAIGSWLSGPRAAVEEMGIDLGYRGERLGLPETGPGSVAPLGRRVGAILVDWALCSVIAYGLLSGGDGGAASMWTLPVFAVMLALTVGTLGMSPGKRLFGIRVIHVSGERLTFPRGVLRSLLIALLLPPLIFDRDTRGLHDRFTEAVQIRV